MLIFFIYIFYKLQISNIVNAKYTSAIQFIFFFFYEIYSQSNMLYDRKIKLLIVLKPISNINHCPLNFAETIVSNS